MKFMNIIWGAGALAIAIVLASAAAPNAAHAQTADCPKIMAGVTRTLQMNPNHASQKNLTIACKNAKNRPALATRNFSTAFVKQFKVGNGKKASASMAKTCVSKLTSVANRLRINPKFANAKDINTACGKALWKPAVATRNFTARFTSAYGIK